jgi:hypothetical protein
MVMKLDLLDSNCKHNRITMTLDARNLHVTTLFFVSCVPVGHLMPIYTRVHIASSHRSDCHTPPPSVPQQFKQYKEATAPFLKP